MPWGLPGNNKCHQSPTSLELAIIIPRRREHTHRPHGLGPSVGFVLKGHPPVTGFFSAQPRPPGLLQSVHSPVLRPYALPARAWVRAPLEATGDCPHRVAEELEEAVAA